MTLLNSYKGAIAFAILFHCAFALGFMSYSFSQNAGVPDAVTENYVSTYSVSRAHKKVTAVTTGVTVKAATSGASVPDKFQGNNALLASLHNAIKSNIHYPRASIKLHQEGRVSVALCLTPEGELLNERVAVSSGFERLDHAAIDAVRETKFTQGAVSTTACFDLPITFALNANNPL